MKKIIILLLLFLLIGLAKNSYAGEGLFKIAPEVGFSYHNVTSEYGGLSGTGWALSWGAEGGYGLTEQLDIILRANYASIDSIKYKNAKILNDTGTLEETFRDILLGLGVKYYFDSGSEWVPYIGGGLDMHYLSFTDRNLLNDAGYRLQRAANKDEFTFGFNIGGGILYRINESFSIGLDPKFAYVFGSNRFYSFTIPLIFTYTF